MADQSHKHLRGMSSVIVLLLGLVAGCSHAPVTWSEARPIPYATAPLLPSAATTIPLSMDATAAVRQIAPLNATRTLELQQVYARPPDPPRGAVFDSLRPTGHWTTPYWTGTETKTIDVAPALDGKTWSYQGDQLQSIALHKSYASLLSTALAGRHARVRYVWAGDELAWWVVRFDDGTEGAVPLLIGIGVYRDGVRLQEGRLYPPRSIFGEFRSFVPGM